MASNVSAGSVSLSMRLDDKEFLKQISSISAQASKILSKSLAPSSNFDLSGIERSIKGLGAQMTKAIGETTKAVDILADTMNDQLSNALEGGVKTGAARATRAVNDFKMPKIKVELDQAQMERQLKIYSDRWKAIDDQRIQQSKIVEDIRNKQLNATPGSKQDMKLGMDLANASKRLQDLRLAANQADQQIVQLERNIRNIGVSTKPVENLKQEIKNIGTSGGDSAKRVRSAFKQTGSSAKLATSQINSGLKQTTQSADKAKSAVSGLGAGLSKAGRMGLALMGIRSILLGIRRIAQSVTESFRVMANSNSAFAGQLNGLTSAFDTLKGSFAAAIAPLVQALIPILQKVVEWATKAFNAIAIFFGALSGKKTVQIAVGSTKQFTENLAGVGGAGGGAAKGLGQATKAAEKYKRSLAGFDEIEILDPTKGQADGGSGSGSGGGPGGGGGSTGGEPIFKEVSTGLSEIGNFAKNAISGIKGLLDNLSKTKAFQILSKSALRAWDNIKNSASNAASRVTNSFKENGPRILSAWSGIGTSLLNMYSRIAGHVWIPFVSGAISAGLEVGASFIDNFLSVFAGLSELIGAVFTPFWDSVTEFFDTHGLEIEEKIYETWRTISVGLSGILDGIGEVFRQVFGGLTEWFSENGEDIKTFLTGVWEDIWAIIGPIWDFILETGTKIFGELRDFFYEIAPKISETVVSYVESAWKIIQPIWEVISKVARTIFGALQKFWEKWGENIQAYFGKKWENIKLIFGGALDVLKNIFEFWGNIFSGDWKAAWENIKNIGITIWNTISGMFQNVFEGMASIFEIFGFDVSGIWENIKGVFQGIIDFVKNVFTGNWEGAWQAVVDIFRNIFDGIVNVVKAPINFIIDILNFFIRGLNKIRIPDWVPLIGGKGINIGEIPKLSHGGIIDQPTLAVVGEQGKEAVMPLENNTGWIDKMAEKLAASIGGGEGGDIHITQPVYLGTDTLIDVIETAIDRESRRRNEPVF